MKKGLIVVSFGTTHEDTRVKTIDVIEKEARDRFPERKFLRAWTSNKIRKIVELRTGEHIPDIKEALDELKGDNTADVLVLNTHIIDGIENNTVKNVIKKRAEDFEKITYASALIETDDDLDYIANLFSLEFKSEDDKCYILMGHGSEHNSNIYYQKLRNKFIDIGRKDIFIANVEGYPYFDDIENELRAYNSAFLQPLMIVAGDHAKNDMIGEESFRQRLTEMGLKVDYRLKGLGEYEIVRKQIFNHIETGIVYEN